MMVPTGSREEWFLSRANEKFLSPCRGSRIFGGTHGKQESTSNMGAALCKWKGDHGDMDALARETLTIDSEEENLYLNASRNGAMRQRSETHDRSAAQVLQSPSRA